MLVLKNNLEGEVKCRKTIVYSCSFKREDPQNIRFKILDITLEIISLQSGLLCISRRAGTGLVQCLAHSRQTINVCEIND